MHVIELLERATRPIFSFEIIPPLRGNSAAKLMEAVETLMPYNPPFIDVTSHSAEVVYKQLPDGSWQRRVKRKRPGTLGICAAIKSRFGVETVPHLLCHGFTRNETEDALIELDYLGIHNIMALYGDDTGSQKKPSPGGSVNKSALDLVEQVNDMNHGKCLEDLLDAAPTDFCIGVAGYPEKHFQAPNLAWDIDFLHRKLAAGAHYVTTQMFFDAAHYSRFVKQCGAAGITAPIIPGIKVFTTKRQLQIIPRRFHVDIPEALAEEVQAAAPEHVAEIGIRWCVKQCEILLNEGAPCVHFYVMQRTGAVRRVVDRLRQVL